MKRALSFPRTLLSLPGTLMASRIVVICLCIYRSAVVHCKASCCIESAFFTKTHSAIKRLYSHYNFALLCLKIPYF